MSSRKPMLSISSASSRMRVSHVISKPCVWSSPRDDLVFANDMSTRLKGFDLFFNAWTTVNWANFSPFCYDQSGRVLLDFEQRVHELERWPRLEEAVFRFFNRLASQRLRLPVPSLGWLMSFLKSQWVCSWIGLASKFSFFQSLAISRQVKFIKISRFFFFLKMVRSHPIALSIYFLSWCVL